jgi:pyruvate dehydrogenase E2 component (dihydrolipoamide acetyltransferase)
MPQMGMTMEEGTIIKWLKQPGETVADGEPVLEVMTDKAVLEIEAPEAGILGPHLAAEGQTLSVGTVLSFILQAGESAPVVAQAEPRVERMDTALAVTASAPAIRSERERLHVSPRARRLADELGLDLSTVVASKPGRIVEADVRRAAAAQAAPQPNLQPLSPTRKVVAERMAHSFRTVPHFHLTVETDAGRLLAWHAQARESMGAHVTLSDVLIKILAHVLGEHPQVNAAWSDDGLLLSPAINIGLATDTERGLVVPVIKAANAKSLAAVAADRQQLVEKAKLGKLTLADLEGGTFTLTNLGMFGIDTFDPIVNAPQAAILAVGRIKERPVAEAGQVVARPTLIMTLACDHRVVDGATAARFLAQVASSIDDPGALRTVPGEMGG